jgi:hypothetical protein
LVNSQTELVAGRRPIAERETELAITKQAIELVRETSSSDATEHPVGAEYSACAVP